MSKCKTKTASVRKDGLPANLGRALKDVRASRGISQEEAAREMKVTTSAVRAWETGRARPMKGMFRENVLAFLASATPQAASE